MAQLIQSLMALATAGGGLSPLRREALEGFATLGLPAYGSESYQRTDLSKLFDGAWTLRDRMLTAREGADLRVFGSLAEGDELGLASVAKDPLALLVRGLGRETKYIHLSRGQKLDKAIRLESLLEGASGDVLTAGRLVLRLEEDAELELIVHDRQQSESPSLSLQSVEIYLAKGAKLRYTDIEESGEKARRISTLHIHQEEGSWARLAFFTLSGGVTRNNYHCDLQGEGAHLALGGLVVARASQHTDNFSYISHSVPHCTSDELFKYVLQDESYGVFTGRILVALDAQKTEAYQNNRNLLLSSKARMQAKPQLEIYADDVRCSHGMTTGQLSADALFYLRQRGIPSEEARRMLSIAFAEEALQLLEEESLQDELREVIAGRFAN